MTQSSSQLNIEGLSLTERMLLVERIWASIMSDQGSLEITASQREELDRLIPLRGGVGCGGLLSLYEDRHRGLGADFLVSIEEMLDRIVRHPEIYPIVHREIRRALIRRFPYGVFYIVEAEAIVVLSVFIVGVSPRNGKRMHTVEV